MREIAKKSQGAIEFLIIIGAVLFFFSVFSIVIQKNISEKNLEKEEIIIQNIALAVQDEINLASEASEGYYRDFKIEENVIGKDYEIKLVEGRIYVKTDRVALSYAVANVTGDIKKGDNTIKKQNGIVYLNA